MNNNNIEHAKKLLKKAIDMNDLELIEMANEILDTIKASSVTQETIKPEKDNNDFIFKITPDDSTAKKGRGIPVNDIKKRVNQYTDDGVEAKDLTTPSIKPTERKRPPFQMIEQTCEKCHKTIKTHPTHKRDFFICDKCIRK